MASEVTPEVWAENLLAALGKPVTKQNVQAITGWANAEGGHWHNGAKYNPLNTTQSAPGAGNTGSQGNIKVYRNWKQGIEATVATLESSGNGYEGILSALSKGNDPNAVAKAIGSSKWGTSASGVENAIKAQTSSSGFKLPSPVETAIGVIPGVGPLLQGLDKTLPAINVPNPLSPLNALGKLTESVIGWIDEPLTPLKFVGGAVLLYIGIREITTGTRAGRSAGAASGRTVVHAVELASVPGAAKRGAAKLVKPKAA